MPSASSSSSSSRRAQKEVLPPLSVVLPEMHTTRPDPDGTYPRTLDDSPLGPTSRAGASGLAPSPRGSGSSRSRAQYANHLSHRSDSSISSNLSERPSSFAGSSSSHASTNRSSPAIPPARTSAQLPERPLERRNLPPINTHGEASRPTDPRYAGSPTSARYPAQPGPGMPVQGYGSQYPGAPSYSGPSASAGYSLNFDNLSDYGDGNKKRRRGNLPKHVTDILRSWFQDHIAHPYPTEDEKVGLMQMTGLSMSQISNWFINARRRSLPQIQRQAQAEQELRENQGKMMQRGHGGS